jgi:hypothetical protein
MGPAYTIDQRNANRHRHTLIEHKNRGETRVEVPIAWILDHIYKKIGIVRNDLIKCTATLIPALANGSGHDIDPQTIGRAAGSHNRFVKFNLRLEDVSNCLPNCLPPMALGCVPIAPGTSKFIK